MKKCGFSRFRVLFRLVIGQLALVVFCLAGSYGARFASHKIGSKSLRLRRVLTGLTDLARSGEPAITRQVAVKQVYDIELAHSIKQAAIGSVNLVKGLTRLTGLTDLVRSGETVIARQVAVKQEYDIGLAHEIEQAAIGSVNLVKGLTRLTGLTDSAVLYPSAGFADTSPDSCRVVQ